MKYLNEGNVKYPVLCRFVMPPPIDIYCGVSLCWNDATHHGMFLEWRNTIKSLSNIWQYFSCLLDEGIPKICKKLNFHDGFLSYLPDSAANPTHLTAMFALKKPSLMAVQVDFKKRLETLFCLYFTTLETYRWP